MSITIIKTASHQVYEKKNFTKTGCSNDDSFDAIKPSLVNRNLLLVVDGVHENEQLRDIVKLSHWLGPGSRVIMTSRDEDLLRGELCLQGGLSAIRGSTSTLLSLRFQEDIPSDWFRTVLGPCRRSSFLDVFLYPLKYSVLGSFLYGKDEKSWKSTLRRLEASQDNSTSEVSSYIGAYERLPKHQIAELERYVGADEGDTHLHITYCFEKLRVDHVLSSLVDMVDEPVTMQVIVFLLSL